jgi:chromosome partitioning protein
MIEKEKDGLVQWTIAKLCDISAPTVNRYISSNGFRPLDLSIHRNQRFSIDNSRKIIQGLLAKTKTSIKKKKFAFYNFKGGTGKTSICFQVSTHMALMGYKVLIIDTDPQGHLSTSCGFPNDDSFLTLYDFLVRKIKFSEIKKTLFDGLDCIPSNLSLTRLEVELNQLPKREERFSIELAEIEKDYDFIFVDTNPTISLLNRNVITFCDVLNIVCETQPYSLNGLKLLVEDLERFYSHMRIPARELNIIPNKYEDRTSSSAEAMTVLREYYGPYIKPDFAIRRSEDINTGAKLGKPLALFAKKNSIALADIVELVHYLLEKYTVKKI